MGFAKLIIYEMMLQSRAVHAEARSCLAANVPGNVSLVVKSLAVSVLCSAQLVVSGVAVA